MYGYPMYYGYGYDWTYILVLIGVVLSMIASHNVKSTFEKYSQVQAFSGLTGAQAAKMILERNGINNVRIQGIAGSLTDNYVPSQKVLNLSQSTINSTSIAAIGVAAHECGHAIQDAKGYQPLVLTRTISPICAVASKISLPLILFGFIISMTPLVQIGLITFAVAISIQLLTLPVEFDASRRAVETLAEYGMVNDRELDGIKAVLKAAALTYVAAAASSVLQLLRLFLLTKGNGRRRR